MKLTKKQQVVILAAALVLVAAGGITAFLLTGKASSKPESFLSMENSVAEVSQIAMEEKISIPKGIYHEQEAQESSLYGDSLYIYQGNAVWAVYSEEDFSGDYYVDSAGTNVLEIPQTDFPEEGSRFSALDFHGNVLGGYFDKDSHMLHVFRYNENGDIDKAVEIKDMPPLTEENPYFQVIKFLADDNYVYMVVLSGTQMPILQVYDWDGNLIVEYEDTQDVAIDGEGTFYSLTSGLQQQTPYALLKYNLSTGEETVETPLWDAPMQVEYNRYDGGIYLMTEKGVAVYHPGIRDSNDFSNDSNLQYILSIGKDTSFFLEDALYIRDFTITENHSLVFNFIQEKGEGETYQTYQKIIPFTFEKGGEKQEKEPTFSITVPYASDFLKDVVTRFEKAYPEEHVEFDAAYPSESEYMQSHDLYRDKISTRLMSGDVGDVVSLSGENIPVQNFLQSDALLDLTPYLGETNLPEMLNSSLLDTVKFGGAIRGLPVTYQVPCLVVDGQLAEKMGVDLNDFDNWADIFHLLPQLKETAPNTPLFNGYKNQLAWELIDSCLPALVDMDTKTVSLNEDWFRETLESFKEVYEDPLLIKDQEFSIVDPLMGSMFATFDLGSDWLRDDFGRAAKVPEQRFLPMFGSQSLEFGEIYGISTTSDNSDVAWKFLSFLYRDETQTAFSRHKIPATETGWEKSFVEQVRYWNTPSDQERLKDFETIAQGADTLQLPKDITNLFAAHLQNYLDDEISLDEMLAAAEEEIWLYLNE